MKEGRRRGEGASREHMRTLTHMNLERAGRAGLEYDSPVILFGLIRAEVLGMGS